MSIYLDANALVALFIPDALNERAAALLRNQAEPLVVSDYAALEFAAVLMRVMRAKVVTPKVARAAIDDFDIWASKTCARAETTADDIRAAGILVRREDLALRSSDAVNVAITQRIGAALLTFDRKLAGHARRVGLSVIGG